MKVRLHIKCAGRKHKYYRTGILVNYTKEIWASEADMHILITRESSHSCQSKVTFSEWEKQTIQNVFGKPDENKVQKPDEE